jgi:hypothetical protein
MFVDHVISRRNGRADNPANLRCLCAHHDSQIKENSSGKRKNNGKPYLVGCDGNGRPLDPEHWWNRRKATQKPTRKKLKNLSGLTHYDSRLTLGRGAQRWLNDPPPDRSASAYHSTAKTALIYTAGRVVFPATAGPRRR